MYRILIFALILFCSVPAWATTDTTGPWGVDVGKPGAFTNLSTALASPATVGKTIVISKVMTINNKTWPTDRGCRFVRGGRIDPAAGKTLNMNGVQPEADLTQQLYGGSGTVTGLRLAVPQSFGALGDDSHDDGAALDKAANAALVLRIPQGVYKTTITHDWRTCIAREFIGDNPNASVIKQYTDNIPIVQLAGERVKFTGLQLKYTNQQSSSNTNAIALATYKLYESEIIFNHIIGAYSGIGIPQVDYNAGAGNTTGNYLYSTHIADNRVANSTGYPLYLKSYIQGSSGNLVENNYIVNSDTVHASAGILVQGWNDGVINQMNVEHGWFGSAIIINTCTNLSVNGLHVEAAHATSNYSAFVQVLNASAKITGVSFIGNSVLSADGVTNNYGLFQVDGTGVLTVDGFTETGSTVTAPNFTALYSGQSTGDATLTGGAYATLTGLQSVPASAVPVLKRYNNNSYYYTLAGMKVTTGSAVPSSGVWALGDVQRNTASYPGSAAEWICVGGGDFANQSVAGTATLTQFVGSITPNATAYANFNVGDSIQVTGNSTIMTITLKFGGNTFNVTPTPGSPTVTNGTLTRVPQFKAITPL
jgi:hypothetical protein